MIWDILADLGYKLIWIIAGLLVLSMAIRVSIYSWLDSIKTYKERRKN